MPRTVASLFLIGSFLACGLRKHTERAPLVVEPDGGYDDVMALIEANRKKNEERREAQSLRNAKIVANFEAQTAGLESQHLLAMDLSNSGSAEQLAPRLDHTPIDNARGPWTKVQIFGLRKNANEFDKVSGLTDASGYLPDKLQQKDHNLKVEVRTFAADREYEIWLEQGRGNLAGEPRSGLSVAETKLLDRGHDPPHSPFVVIDGKYVGGYKELAKAIAKNYPDRNSRH